MKASEPKAGLTIDRVALADGHLRFVLNTAEGLLVALGTSVRTASQDVSNVEPETAAALKKVADALDKAFAVTRNERSAASAALKARLLHGEKKGRKA